MKKIIALILALTMALALAACGGSTGPETPAEPAPEVTEAPESPEEPAPDTEALPEGEPMPEAELSAEDAALMEKLEALTAHVDDEMTFMNEIVPRDQYEYQLFIPYTEGYRAAVSSPMIGSIPHSVVLLELPEGADVEAVAAEIEENMDPRKWICVTADVAWVKTSGQYVLLVMSSEDMAAVVEANFDTVFGA